MSAAARQRPRPGTLVLDHVSHFVPDLAAAARTLEALGFRVAARSAQRTHEGPTGTANVCVMLEAGYVEFLAPVAETPHALGLRAAMKRHAGVRLACFGTRSVLEEHARLARHGFEPLPPVQLLRPVRVGGRTVTAHFTAVRVPPGRMPEGRVQFVEQLTPQRLWRPALLRHANGVRGLAAVFVAADDRFEVAARWARFAALLPAPAGGFVHLASARGHILVGEAGAWRALLGAAPEAPSLAGYALECRDPDRLARRCAQLGLAPRRLRARLYSVILPPALGGAWIFGTPGSLGLPRVAGRGVPPVEP